MPWRLIILIAVLVVLLFFIGLNVNNKCDLSLGFVKFNDVPVYLTIFISFLLGMVFSLPFFFIRKKPKKEKPPKDKAPATAVDEKTPRDKEADSPYGID